MNGPFDGLKAIRDVKIKELFNSFKELFAMLSR